MISGLGALYCLLYTKETPAARARVRAAQVLSPNRVVTSPSPIEDQPPDPAATTDIAGRRRFAQIVRKASTLLDPDPDPDPDREGRYRTYPRTPGEENFNPHLRKHEEKFYLARGAGPSQISLIPGTPNVQASGSGSRTSRPDSGGSRFLEVPQDFHRSLILPVSDSSIPQITISPDSSQ